MDTKSPDSGYTLTPNEQMVFASLNQRVLNAKMIVYNLTASREEALKDVDAMEAQFGGALAFLANLHGMSAATISPDLSRIHPRKE